MTSRFTVMATCLLGLAAPAVGAGGGLYAKSGWVADIPPGGHQAQGVATILDHRTIQVEHFTYDGTAPAVYFYLGATDTHSAFAGGLQLDPLLDRAYSDESLTLTLPAGESLDDYGAISVWCAEFSVNFSSASFLPPAAPYGRAGWAARFPLHFHDVQGTVRMVNDHLLHVTNFTFDGGGPAVYFYLGADNTDAAFETGLQVSPQLDRAYDDESLVLTVPEGAALDDYAAISVWCAAVGVSFSSNEFRADGDFDGDGVVAGMDYAVFYDCMGGPNVNSPPPGCAAADFAHADVTGDYDVDLCDFAEFQNVFAAPALTAQYRVTFDATWSAATHPVDFPPNPHFSGLIGGTHSDGAIFWQEDTLASDGIESMAETGSKTLLMGEVQTEITAGNAGEVISGGGIGPSPGSTSTTFTATQDFNLATVVTMIAPSPDWFVGVAGIPLFENNQWVDQVTYELQPYDAGTDSGTTYTSPNDNTNPPDPITEITGYPFESGGMVAPLGTFTFERID